MQFTALVQAGVAQVETSTLSPRFNCEFEEPSYRQVEGN